MKKLSPAFQYLLPIIVVVFTWLQLEISVDPYNIPTIELKYILLNLFTLGAIWAVFMLLCNRIWLSCLLMSILGSGVSIANHYVLEFKGVPLSFLELKNFKTAMNVVSGYTFNVTLRVKAILLIFACCIVLCIASYFFSHKFKQKGTVKSRVWASTLIIASIVAVFQIGYFGSNAIKPKKTIGWLWSEAYLQYGYTACSVESFCSLFNIITVPDGYSEEAIDAIEIQTKESESTPDIILILNETFYDLAQIAQLNEDAPYFDFINSMDNLYSGYAIAPSFGGGTNSSEYEILTGNSLQIMPGITPFNILDLNNANSIVSHLNSLGYDTLGSHSEPGENYYRNRGYSELAFNHIFFDTDFENKAYYHDRWYETDESLYSNLIRWYHEEMSQSPRFAYLLTIQNHGDWNLNPSEADLVHAGTDFGEYQDSVNEFLTGLKISDQAFKDLTDYYAEVDRPVIICMLGDHSPNFADEIADSSYSEDELNLLLRKTPLLIWANYDLGIDNHDLGTMSMNYVVPTLLDMAGVSLSPYYQYMLELKKDIPILTSYGVYYDAEGNMYSYEDETEYSEAVNNYFYLEYNNLSENRKQELFDAAS